jgi:hypothetical protein
VFLATTISRGSCFALVGCSQVVGVSDYEANDSDASPETLAATGSVTCVRTPGEPNACNQAEGTSPARKKVASLTVQG